MFDKIGDIVMSEDASLRGLASAAGADYRVFWRGADFAGVDLRGQDLRDFDLTGADLGRAIMDDTTLLPVDA
jgi:uncharacterized protein YjbI with pentapeptide repeats